MYYEVGALKEVVPYSHSTSAAEPGAIGDPFFAVPVDQD